MLKIYLPRALLLHQIVILSLGSHGDIALGVLLFEFVLHVLEIFLVIEKFFDMVPDARILLDKIHAGNKG